MEKICLRTLVISVLLGVAMLVQAKGVGRITSPNGMLTLLTGVNTSGQPYYELQRGKRTIVSTSLLGVRLREGDMERNFRILSFSTAGKDETWTQPWGEETHVRNHYNELTATSARKASAVNVGVSRVRRRCGLSLCFPQPAFLARFRYHGREYAVCLPLRCQGMDNAHRWHKLLRGLVDCITAEHKAKSIYTRNDGSGRQSLYGGT